MAVVSPQGVAVLTRPPPPTELSETASDVWRQVVGALPADWFPPESQPLLAQYCRHAEVSWRLSLLIEQTERAEEFDIELWRDLLKEQRAESASMNSLARSLRLSPQTRMHPRTAGRKGTNEPTGNRPWESE